jgi:hypothetical protein
MCPFVLSRIIPTKADVTDIHVTNSPTTPQQSSRQNSNNTKTPEVHYLKEGVFNTLRSAGPRGLQIGVDTIVLLAKMAHMHHLNELVDVIVAFLAECAGLFCVSFLSLIVISM